VRVKNTFLEVAPRPAADELRLRRRCASADCAHDEELWDLCDAAAESPERAGPVVPSPGHSDATPQPPGDDGGALLPLGPGCGRRAAREPVRAAVAAVEPNPQEPPHWEPAEAQAVATVALDAGVQRPILSTAGFFGCGPQPVTPPPKGRPPTFPGDTPSPPPLVVPYIRRDPGINDGACAASATTSDAGGAWPCGDAGGSTAVPSRGRQGRDGGKPWRHARTWRLQQGSAQSCGQPNLSPAQRGVYAEALPATCVGAPWPSAAREGRALGCRRGAAAPPPPPPVEPPAARALQAAEPPPPPSSQPRNLPGWAGAERTGAGAAVVAAAPPSPAAGVAGNMRCSTCGSFLEEGLPPGQCCFYLCNLHFDTARCPAELALELGERARSASSCGGSAACARVGVCRGSGDGGRLLVLMITAGRESRVSWWRAVAMVLDEFWGSARPFAEALSVGLLSESAWEEMRRAFGGSLPFRRSVMPR